jgi:anti-sigma-K factor RskA
MSADEHAAIRELLPALALGSLDEAEAGATAAHVATCSDCRDELAEYETVVDALALAAPDAAPSPELRARLLAAAGATAAHSPTPATQPQPAADAPTTPATRQPRPGRRPAATERPRPARRLWPALAVVGLAAIVLGGLLWAGFGRLVSPVAPVTLLPSDEAPEAEGELVFGRGGRGATLTVRGLPVLPAGQQYQLWLVSDGQRESGAVFSVNDNGWAETAVEMERAAAEYDRFGITIEPAGGSPGPTGERVLGFARDG